MTADENAVHLQALFVRTVARHFPDATIAGNVVDTGFARVKCTLAKTGPWGRTQSAQLLYDVSGGGLAREVQMMTTGYGDELGGAIVHSACGWACAFGPVLRSGLAKPSAELAIADVAPSFLVLHKRQRYRIFHDRLDHVLHGAPAQAESTEAVRARWGREPSFAYHVLAGGKLPLVPDRPQLLTIFVGELPERRIVEVKLDGELQPGFDPLAATAAKAPPPSRQVAMMRELAIIVAA